MVKVCGTLCKKCACKKSGFGIVEVLIAAAVLGFLYTALLNLQTGNREALLRIRGRDGATEVAQNIIDSLGALGISNLTDAKLMSDGAGGLTLKKSNGVGGGEPDTINVTRTWTGQPGIIEHTMEVKYKAVVTVSPDAQYKANNTTMFSENSSLVSEQTVSHVYAKRLDVKVIWDFKNSKQSIVVSRVIR